jgi:hypothetical protein
MTLRAEVVTKMADEEAAVAVLLATDGAAGLLRSMLGIVAPDGSILDPKEERVIGDRAEPGDQGIIGVEHDSTVRGGCYVTPTVDNQIELAVTVKLIAEKICQQYRARTELVDEAREPKLVNLKQTKVAALIVERRRNATSHVRARAVVNKSRAVAAHDFGDYRTCSCLAIGR